jgi:hypothetical protein
MSRTIFKAKTYKVNRATTAVASCHASAVCRNLDNWPRSWMGLEKDLPPGEELVVCFRPFIEHLASSSLSSKTIRRHVDNLCILGGNYPRPELHAFCEKGCCAAASSQGGSCRRRPTDPQRLGRGATLPRFDLPQTPSLPQPTSALSPPVTHRFPGRGKKKSAGLPGKRPAVPHVCAPARWERLRMGDGAIGGELS